MRSIRKEYLATGLLVVVLMMFGACKKEDEGPSRQDEERLLIEQYAEDHNLNGTFTASGLYYVIIESGSDFHPDAYSRVNVKFKGYFLDGEVFDESEIFTEYLYNLIHGWIEGLKLIGEGGKIKLIIPSHLGYSDDKVLVFDITLYSFTK